MQRVFRRIIVVCALGNLALFTFVVAGWWFFGGIESVQDYIGMKRNRFPYMLLEAVTVCTLVVFLARKLINGPRNVKYARQYRNRVERGSLPLDGLATGTAYAFAADPDFFEVTTGSGGRGDDGMHPNDLRPTPAIGEEEPPFPGDDWNGMSINPATGLPMDGDIDVAGNLLGMDGSLDCSFEPIESFSVELGAGVSDCFSGINGDWT